MPLYRRHFEPGQLQFLTTSTYRRTKLFDSDRFRGDFVEVLGQLRQETGFLLTGWVLMPEHFHLLIKPEPAESTSRFMQELKKRTAQRIVDTLRDHQQYSWCRRMLTGLRLPQTPAFGDLRGLEGRGLPGSLILFPQTVRRLPLASRSAPAGR